MRPSRLLAVLLAPGLLLGAAPGAAASSWVLTAASPAPASTGTGLAQDERGARYLTGERTLLRTDERLRPGLVLRPAIPGGLASAPGFARLGDPGWDPARGRLVVPLACASGTAGCGRGGLSVYGRDLVWDLAVTLDPGDGPPAAWAAPAPDGTLVWTSAGADLIAYRSDDLALAGASAHGAPVSAAVRLPGAAPGGSVSGGAFWEGRLYIASQEGEMGRVHSVDPAAPVPRLEIERALTGTARGLDAGPAPGGVLHWLVAEGAGPAARLLTFARAGEVSLTAAVDRRTLRAGRPATIGVTVRQTLSGRTAPLSGALVGAGAASARTDDDGHAELRVRPLRAGRLEVRASSAELRAAPVQLTVLPSIGPPLSGPPSATVSAGAGARRVRAGMLVDCSGGAGCQAPRTRLRPSGCVRARAGADLRIALHRRPARTLSVLVTDVRGRVADWGRAVAQGRSALGWRFPVRGRLPSRATITLVAVYPDRTGAITVLRLRSAGC